MTWQVPLFGLREEEKKISSETKSSPPSPPVMNLERAGMASNSNGVLDMGVDFAQYFCTYAFLYHQKEMLSDRVRMDAYYDAVFGNKHHHFMGKAAAFLLIWSALAGARKVYAVEATKISEHACALVKANQLEGVVEVIQGSIEDITLPEKVDVIISEWMAMFDSVICGRDRWLKPSGVM